MLMFNNKQILVIILLFLSSIVRSQTCDLQLKGIVRDEENSEHLGFAVVKLLSPEKIIQTNEKGEFVFDNLCKGNYQILIQHVGCKDTIFSVDLVKSKKVIFNLPDKSQSILPARGTK